MEMQSPFPVQKGREKCLILTYIKLFPFLCGLSTCYDNFYWLFYVILSKEKLKILMTSMTFTIHLYLVQASFKSKYKDISLRCRITQFAICSLCMHMYFILP